MTAHAITSEQERILKAGITAIVSKPFRKQALLDELSKRVRLPAADAAAVAVDQVANPSPVVPIAPMPGQAAVIVPASGGRRPADPLAKYGPVLDRDVLAQLADETGHTEIPALLAILRTEVQGRAAQLRKAAASGDVGVLMTTCHALAGSAGTVGAKRLHKLCKETETACLKQKDPRYLSMTPHILREIDALMAALTSYNPGSTVDACGGPARASAVV